MTTAVEVADRLYQRWNSDGVAGLGDCVDPAIVLICDPLRPAQSALRGLAGWEQWVARWEEAYEHVRITVDGLVPVDGEHVLALVSITATPIGATVPLRWAAAHVWTLRDGRIAGWATHLDLAAARDTLDV
jgi:ketosteroid isomerase-like protein